MTDQHPLTDEICKQIVEDNVYWHPDSPLLDLTEKTCMRASYDMGRDDQLEEAQAFLDDFLEKFSWRYSWQATYEVRAFVNNFKSCMRPQEDS
jgi:hypothetical protein